jgi:hypothetical protein
MATADDVLRPDFLDGIADLPLATVRERRAQCLEVETALSFARRLVHGRLDILANERQRRVGGEASDLHALVEDLPAILAEKGRAAGPGRLVQQLGPTEAVDPLVARLDELTPPGIVSDPTAVTGTELDGHIERLVAFEQELSAQRHVLHDLLDALQAEITRRYRTGEATVDALLQ